MAKHYALVALLCFMLVSCTHSNHNSVAINPAAIPTGLQQMSYPDSSPSSRALVNNRGVFLAYAQHGQLYINNKSAVSADIYINEKPLLAAHKLTPNRAYQFDLSGYTKHGRNTVKVENVSPSNGQFSLHFSYPKLVFNAHSAIDFSAVDALINADIKAGFPGAVLAVVQQGRLIKLTAYGDAKKYQHNGKLLSAPQAMQTDTLFDLASNTKIFATNLALMKLVSEQKLDIEQPVATYLPQYAGQGRELRTVRDLLSHTSGYPAIFRFYKQDNPLGIEFYSQNSARTKQLSLTKLPFRYDQTKPHYSDINYVILGALVEQLTGQNLADYLQQHIYRPLGLTHTVFNPLTQGFNASQIAATELAGNTRGGRINFNNIRTQVIQGQVHDELAYYSLAGVAGHAGLFSRAEDLAVLAQLLLNQGGYDDTQLFTAATLARFLTPQHADDSYALGFRLAGNNQARRWHFGPYASAQAYGHTGWTGTATVIDPYYDLAIILLTNARHSEISGSQQQFQFIAKQFETAKYGSVISLVYEAVLNH